MNMNIVVISEELLDEAISGLRTFGQGAVEVTVKKLLSLKEPKDSLCVNCGSFISSKIGCTNVKCMGKPNLN